MGLAGSGIKKPRGYGCLMSDKDLTQAACSPQIIAVEVAEQQHLLQNLNITKRPIDRLARSLTHYTQTWDDEEEREKKANVTKEPHYTNSSKPSLNTAPTSEPRPKLPPSLLLLLLQSNPILQASRLSHTSFSGQSACCDSSSSNATHTLKQKKPLKPPPAAPRAE